MLVYPYPDAKHIVIPYLNLTDEFGHLTIAVCTLRITDPDYDGHFIPYIVARLKLIDRIDRVLIDDMTEALSLDSIEQLFTSIETECGIPKRNIAFVSGGEAETAGVMSYPIFYRVDSPRLGNYKNNNVVPWNQREKLLISLGRRPCWFRVALTEELIKRDLLTHSIVSCGSDSTFGDDGWIQMFATPEFRKYFPMTVDGAITREDEYVSNGLEFSNAFVNIVSESSHDVMPDKMLKLQQLINETNRLYTPDAVHHWERVFVTEKTIKPIAMRQIPIFNTVRHHVRHLRDIGLDLFDDVVDHSYDELEDPVQRIWAVANQAEILYRRGHDYFRSIPKIEQRLEHNYQCAQLYYETALQIAHTKIKEFLNHGHVTV